MAKHVVQYLWSLTQYLQLNQRGICQLIWPLLFRSENMFYFILALYIKYKSVDRGRVYYDSFPKLWVLVF